MRSFHFRTAADNGMDEEGAQALAGAGFRVAAHYHRAKDSAEKLVADIQMAGGEALAVEGDLSNQDVVAGLYKHIGEHFGPVECLVNNAGITQDALLAFMSDEQWDEVIATNLRF